MKSKILGLLAVGLLAGPMAANAVQSFNWSAECGFGCTGTAMAVLTTSDAYTLGTSLNLADFVSFSYLSSSGAINIPGAANATLTLGGLPALLPGSASQFIIDFAGSSTIFCAPDGGQGSICNPTGWHMIFAPLGFNEGNMQAAGTWGTASVPEPGTLALLGLGLLGLGMTRRRKAA